jgi:hypothetical protein
MNFLPKNRQKRNQLFLVAAAAVILIFGIGFGVIRPQYAKLSKIQKDTVDVRDHLKSFDAVIQQSEETSNELARVTAELSGDEQDMATGDIYAWTIDTMRHFKTNYKVELPEIGQPSVSDVDIFPHFPYKQLKFNIHGIGYYHDIGKFIADFENRYPHMRVVNLDIEPVGSDSEELTFRMDIVALIKSAS